MGKRKRNHRVNNLSNTISADEFRDYMRHASLKDLEFLENLVSERRQELLARKHAGRFPIYQRAQRHLDEVEQDIHHLITQEMHVAYPFELTPEFLYGYFQDYPSDIYLELYTDWQQTLKQLNGLQEKIGEIIAVQNRIKQAGFKVMKTRFSQRSLSTYLYLPLEQADAFRIVFGGQYEMDHLDNLLVDYNQEDADTFSVRISDHMNGTFYNQKTQQQQRYHQADVNIYI